MGPGGRGSELVSLGGRGGGSGHSGPYESGTFGVRGSLVRTGPVVDTVNVYGTCKHLAGVTLSVSR